MYPPLSGLCPEEPELAEQLPFSDPQFSTLFTALFEKLTSDLYKIVLLIHNASYSQLPLLLPQPCAGKQRNDEVGEPGIAA